MVRVVFQKIRECGGPVAERQRRSAGGCDVDDDYAVSSPCDRELWFHRELHEAAPLDDVCARCAAGHRGAGRAARRPGRRASCHLVRTRRCRCLRSRRGGGLVPGIAGASDRIGILPSEYRGQHRMALAWRLEGRIAAEAADSGLLRPRSMPFGTVTDVRWRYVVLAWEFVTVLGRPKYPQVTAGASGWSGRVVAVVPMGCADGQDGRRCRSRPGAPACPVPPTWR